MSVDLSGMTAVVTGAAKRLGRHLALEFAKAGADVVVHYNQSQADAEATGAEIEKLGRKAHLISVDFADPAGPEAFAASVKKKAGRVDIVVHNVGNYLVKPVEQTTGEEWRDLFETNVFAPMEITRLLLPHFPASGGAIFHLGYAGLAHLSASSTRTAYQATKTTLYLATQALAERLGPRKIRVNMISPGHLDNSVDLPPEAEAAFPLGRPGRPEDIAAAIFFFLSRDSYITGQNLDVAGGWRP